MCWLPIGLGLVGGIVAGIAAYLAKGWGWGLWALLFGALCGAAVLGTLIVFLLRAAPTGRPRSGTGVPPP